MNLACAPELRSVFGASPHGGAHKYYGRLEYLWMDLSRDHAPPLVTTGLNGCTLSDPGVEVLYGNRLNQNMFSGGRITAGMWLDANENDGVEASFMMTEQGQTTFLASSPGNPMLARPFYNINLSAEDCELVARDGVLSGSVEVKQSTQLLGADLNWRRLLWASYQCYDSLHWHVDSLVGLKYLQLNEELTITERLLTGPDFGVPGVSFLLVDRFATQNRFLGLNLGLQGEVRYCQYFANARGSIALGGTNQNVQIDGSTVIGIPGQGSSLQAGGLYALPTNIGSYNKTAFSVVPQVSVQAGGDLTEHLRVYVGYDAFCWTDIVRPGQQIDRVLNVTQLPSSGGPSALVGAARPMQTFNSTTLWGQALSVGVEVRF